ncbi:hypothetical protein FQA39_LY12379 [Lamprigera yunnana]|nr:hypothetical protein FQA39_LY12379 [Lamprigera yunnana]
MVIKETLRLYPLVPHFGRRIAHDVKYENVLPKGIDISIFTYGIHRNPNLYPNADKFEPERFSIENQSSRPNYAYVPFNAGHRNYIGQKICYARNEGSSIECIKEISVTSVLHKTYSKTDWTTCTEIT